MLGFVRSRSVRGVGGRGARAPREGGGARSGAPGPDGRGVLLIRYCDRYNGSEAAPAPLPALLLAARRPSRSRCLRGRYRRGLCRKRCQRGRLTSRLPRGGGGVPDRPNLDRSRDTHAGDPRFPFGWCASPEAPTPSSVPASSPRFATDPGVGRLRGRCLQLPDQLGVARGHGPTQRGRSAGTVAPLADRPAPCGLRAGPLSGVGADTEGQLPPRISFVASVRFFTPSAL